MSKKQIAKSDIKYIRETFPEVEWDRWAGDPEYYNIFGWIARKDGQRDFLVLSISKGEITAYCTSSAKYSADFAKRLGYVHHACNPVKERS